MQGRKEGLPNPKIKKELPSFKAPASSSNKRAQSTPVVRTAESLLDGLPDLGPGLQGATLKDLCEEDKQKVARLIRQVVSITKEKEKLQKGAEEDRQSQQKVLEALQAQNRELIEEVTGLRLKVVQAQGLLRSYQHKLRALKEGPPRDVALRPTSPLEPELLTSPTYAPLAGLPRPLATDSVVLDPLASPSIAAPTLQSILSPTRDQGGTAASAQPINTEEEDARCCTHSGSLPTARRANTNTLHASDLSEGSKAGVALSLSTALLGSGAPSSENGVWAAWAELEQRIRCINGELAQTKTAAGGAAKEPAEAVLSPTLESEPSPRFTAAVKGSDEEKAVRTEDVLTKNAPQAASEGQGKVRSEVDAAQATNGPTQANGTSVNSPPAQELGSSHKDNEAPTLCPRPLLGGLVSQPQLTCHISKEPLLFSIQPITAPADAVQRPEQPPRAQTEAIPTLLSPSSPAPSLSSTSPSRAEPAESLVPPYPNAGSRVTSPSFHKDPPQKPTVDLRPVPADVAVSSGQERMQQDSRAGVDPVSHQRASTAVLASEIEADLIQRSRETDARVGSKELLKGHDSTRVQVLRFDPTVGEAGAFYYVDAQSEGEPQDNASGNLTSVEGARVAKNGARRALSPSQRNGDTSEDTRAADEESVESGMRRSERGDKAKPRSIEARHPVRSERKENGAQNESPERGRLFERRPRWVSGMLYDSSLLELVEELEMRDGRESQEAVFEDTIPTQLERGEGLRAQRNASRQDVSRTARLGKGHASVRGGQHRLCKDPRLEPEVLILSNGW